MCEFRDYFSFTLNCVFYLLDLFSGFDMKKEPEKAEEHKKYLLKILKRKQLSAMPYWDKYVEEYGTQNVRSDLPKTVMRYLKKLKPEVKRKVSEWLRKDLEK